MRNKLVCRFDDPEISGLLRARYINKIIKIYLTDKSVVTRETISSIEAKLPQQDFLRIHRSYIVAKNAIDSFTSEVVEVGKKQLPVSRGYKEQALKRLES